MFPGSIVYDLLLLNVYLRLVKNPQALVDEVQALTKEELAHPIIIDEVQKVPALLDAVHWLIKNTDAYFILCGSSARKLKRSGVNLLGGRAWRFHFYPSEEIQAEGLVRNLPAFARFLDALPFSLGELVNYSNIARDCGVDAKTVKEYYQILV